MKIEITIPDTPTDLSNEAYHSTPYDQAHPGDKRRIHVPQYAADRGVKAALGIAVYNEITVIYVLYALVDQGGRSSDFIRTNARQPFL